MENDIQTKLAVIKQHTKALIQDLGVGKACELTGRSSATLRRYTSGSKANEGHLISVADLVRLEQAAGYPYVTASLAEVNNYVINARNPENQMSDSVNSDVMRLASRFGSLMSEYYTSIEDGEITRDEAKRLLNDTLALQSILVEMKQNLEIEAKS